MDNELNERLNTIEKMLSDNNAMLIKLRKSQKNATRMRVVYWILVIILCVGSIYFVAPYLGQLGAIYGIGSTNNPASPDSGTSSTNTTLTKLLNQYEASQKTTQ